MRCTHLITKAEQTHIPSASGIDQGFALAIVNLPTTHGSNEGLQTKPYNTIDVEQLNGAYMLNSGYSCAAGYRHHILVHQNQNGAGSMTADLM